MTISIKDANNEQLNEIVHGLTKVHLIQLDADHPNIFLTPETRENFLTMQKAAAVDGINLQIASGYRGFDRQNKIFTDKYTGKRPVLNRQEVPINDLELNPSDRIRAILIFSSIPGFSRHHFGTDLDVYDPDLLPLGSELQLTNQEYSTGPQAPLGKWLTNNIQRFNFFRPFQKTGPYFSGELWHISYAPESDVLTNYLSKEESQLFLLNTEIPGKEAITGIINTEFNQRFKIFSNTKDPSLA